MSKERSTHYSQGVTYFLMSLLTSVSNDTISKYLAIQGLPPSEITFFRISLGILFLIGYGVYSRELWQKPPFPTRQMVRGLLFVIASTLWTHGLSKAPISIATLMNFAIPLFILLLSPLFLAEKITPKTWTFTILGLLGVAIVLWPTFEIAMIHSYTPTLLAAVFLFALLDIINKKYAHQEPLFATIFYPSCIALLFTLPSCCWSHWVMPTPGQWPLLSLLGLGGNAIIYLLLKAYRRARISSLAPLRYLELLFSIAVGYGLFGDIPGTYQLVGTAIIIPAVWMVI